MTELYGHKKKKEASFCTGGRQEHLMQKGAFLGIGTEMLKKVFCSI